MTSIVYGSSLTVMMIVAFVLVVFSDRTSGQDCEDSNTECAGWAKTGECTKNPRYMLGNCKKSCNTCGGGIDYVGCFADTGDRAMPFAARNVPSVKSCIDICRDRDEMFAGMQYISECYCGDNYAKHGRTDKCTMKCPDGGNCGGIWASDVYRVGDYVGCFADTGDRAMPFAARNVPHVKACIDICRDRNERFAGMQYISECYCGSDYAKHGRTDKCTMKCRDGANCGGIWASDVYRVDYVGCFADTGDRAMPFAARNVSSVKSCIDICRDRNEKFAGMQYISECYCGSDYAKHGRTDKCTMKCRDGANCGGIWASDVYRVDTDPCHAQPCQNGATCSRDKMGYKCTCTPGFKGDHCTIDINECSNNRGGCQHMCTNTEGSYQCSCRSGYQLVNGKRCTDINECSNNRGGCQHMCTNTEGSYQCSCRSGYQLVNGKRCTDINECANNNGGCQHMCTNTEGSYQCSCRSGYQLVNGKRCTDINECANNKGGCQHRCTNTEGFYHCSCRSGYQLVNGKRCTDINECANNRGGCQHMCNNTEGSYQCSCFSGYQLVNGKRCTDINECANTRGGCQHMCNNTEDSYQCSCRSGYQLVNGKRCTDINECSNNKGGCQYMCTNTEDSYQCSCSFGYQLVNGTRCTVLIAVAPTVGIPILIAAILTAVILTALIGVGTVVCYRRTRQVANLTVLQGSKRSPNNTYVDTANPLKPDNNEETYETLNF